MNSIRFLPKDPTDTEKNIKPKEYVSIYSPVLDNSNVDIPFHLGDVIDIDFIKYTELQQQYFTLCEEFIPSIYSDTDKNEKIVHHLTSADAECILKPNTHYKVIKIEYMVQEELYDKKDVMTANDYTPEISIRKFNLWEFIESSFPENFNQSVKNLFVNSLFLTYNKTNFIVFHLEKIEEDN